MSDHHNDPAEFQAAQARQTDRNSYNGLAAEVTNLWRAPGSSAGQSLQNKTDAAFNISQAAPGVKDNGMIDEGNFGSVSPATGSHINPIANLRTGAKSRPGQGAESLNGKSDNEAMSTELKNGGLRENASDVPRLGKSLPDRGEGSLGGKTEQGKFSPYSIDSSLTAFHGDRQSIRTGQAIPDGPDNIPVGQAIPLAMDHALRNPVTRVPKANVVYGSALNANPLSNGKRERGNGENMLDMPPLNWGYTSPSTDR